MFENRQYLAEMISAPAEIISGNPIKHFFIKSTRTFEKFWKVNKWNELQTTGHDILFCVLAYMKAIGSLIEASFEDSYLLKSIDPFIL